MSGRGIRADVSALLRTYPRLQILLIAVVALGVLICMVGAVIVLAIVRS